MAFKLILIALFVFAGGIEAARIPKPEENDLQFCYSLRDGADLIDYSTPVAKGCVHIKSSKDILKVARELVEDLKLQEGESYQLRPKRDAYVSTPWPVPRVEGARQRREAPNPVQKPKIKPLQAPKQCPCQNPPPCPQRPPKV